MQSFIVLRSYLIFLFLWLPLVQALEIKESLLVVVQKIYPENIFALTRGIEDGVSFQDHIKISKESVFVGRAVCIKTLPKVSFWKVYRTTKGALQLSSQYKITSIPLSEIRPAVLREISSIKLDFLQNETQDNVLKKE